MKTLETRLSEAMALHAAGRNCAQCVAMVFDDVVPLSAAQLEVATAALGGGIAGTRSACGCVTAMAVVAGARSYAASPDKRLAYDAARPAVEAFGVQNGSTICAELRHPGGKPCRELIADAITLLHNQLTQ